MIICNGKGQIGELIKDYHILNNNYIFYHTWNFIDKSENIQKNEYLKYKKCLYKNKDNKLIFISTSNKDKNYYTYYKRICEELTIQSKGYIIKLPNIIGKGICKRFKNNECFPDDKFINIIELKECVNQIKHILNMIKDYTFSYYKNFEIQGENITSKNIYNLIQFGVKN